MRVFEVIGDKLKSLVQAPLKADEVQAEQERLRDQQERIARLEGQARVESRRKPVARHRKGGTT